MLPYYLVVHPSIKRIEDLKGKTGGNHLAGTVADFALQASLKKLGLQPGKDLSLRVIGGGNERMVALQKNIVQFTVATEPGRVMAEKLGFPVLLDMAKLQLPFPQNGIYTSTKLIRENPDMVRKYLKAYVEAIHYFKSRKEETIKIMSKYSRLENRKLLEDTWEWYILYLPEAPYPPVDGYRLILDEQATTNPKAAQANAKDFVDLRFIKELEDSGFIKSLYGK